MLTGDRAAGRCMTCGARGGLTCSLLLFTVGTWSCARCHLSEHSREGNRAAHPMLAQANATSVCRVMSSVACTRLKRCHRVWYLHRLIGIWQTATNTCQCTPQHLNIQQLSGMNLHVPYRAAQAFTQHTCSHTPNSPTGLTVSPSYSAVLDQCSTMSVCLFTIRSYQAGDIQAVANMLMLTFTVDQPFSMASSSQPAGSWLIDTAGRGIHRLGCCLTTFRGALQARLPAH